MTTIGEILRSAREKKKLTIEAVEKATKIRAKFIDSLEANKFDNLPGPTYARGFVKNYAAFLNLPVDEMLAFYRRQASGEVPSNIIKSDSRSAVRGLRMTPQLFTAISVGLLLVCFFAYLIFTYFQFAGAPALTLNSPANNVVVREDSVEIVGKTDPGATLAINNQQVTISENGTFDVKVPLQPGLNTLSIVATNKFHRKTIVTRNLRLEK